jgi:hypothetical protein
MSGAVGGWGALKASPDHVLSRPFSGSSPDESPVVPAARRHLKRGSGDFATLASPEREESREGEEMESGGGKRRRGPRKRTLTLGLCGCAGFNLAGSGLRAFDYFCCFCVLFPGLLPEGPSGHNNITMIFRCFVIPLCDCDFLPQFVEASLLSRNRSVLLSSLPLVRLLLAGVSLLLFCRFGRWNLSVFRYRIRDGRLTYRCRG